MTPTYTQPKTQRTSIFRMRFILLFIFAFVCLGNMANAQFTNGDFNAGTYGCTAGTGWTTAAGTMSAQRTNLYSNNWIDLTPCNAWGNGTYIQQSVPVTIGNCYRIAFRLGSWCGWDQSDAGVYISINGTQLGGRIYNDTIICGAPTPINWGNRLSPVFTATTNPIVVRFTGEGRCTALSPTTGTYACNPLNGIGNPGVIGLDDIVLIPVTGSGTAFSLGNDTAICNGQPLVLDAGNPTLTHTWSTGASTQTISVTTAGTYWCTVTGGCASYTDTINITTIAAPIVALGNDTVVCNSQPFTLNGGNATLPHLWSTGVTTQTITVNQPGTYWCKVTNVCGSITDTIHVNAVPPLVVSLGPDTSICLNGTYTLNAGNTGASYHWSTGATTQTITVNAPGHYSCQVSTICDTATDVVNIGTTASPVPVVQNGLTCPGEKEGVIRLTPQAGAGMATYVWTDNLGNTLQTHQSALGDSITQLGNGTYHIHITTAGGCDTTVHANIALHPAPTAAFTSDSVVCTSELLQLKNNSIGVIGSYLWFFGTGDTSSLKDPSYHYTQVGTYNITLVATGTYCKDSAKRTVRVTDFSSFGLTANLAAAEPGQQIVLTTSASEPYNVLSWSPIYLFPNQIATWQSLKADTGRRYVVTARSFAGCVDTASVFVDVNQIAMPNAFTPNGDGVNDYFVPILYGGTAQLLSFEIFNRWGNMVYGVYRDNNPKGWDGTYKGAPAELGVYCYQGLFETPTGRVSVKGNVSLLR